MTIRFLKPWNGYQPDAVVSGLTNEAALIAGGLASDDLDGGNDGRTYEAKFATDASGNVTGLVGPDGQYDLPVYLELDDATAAARNASRLRAALLGRGYVRLSGRGTAWINETAIIDSDTTLDFGNVRLKLAAGTNNNIIRSADAQDIIEAYAGANQTILVTGGTATVMQGGITRTVGEEVYIDGSQGNTAVNGWHTVTAASYGSWSFAVDGSQPTNPSGVCIFVSPSRRFSGANLTRTSNIVTVSETGHQRHIGDHLYLQAGTLSDTSFAGLIEILSAVPGVSWTYASVGSNGTPTGQGNLLGTYNIELRDMQVDGNKGNQSPLPFGGSANPSWGIVIGNSSRTKVSQKSMLNVLGRGISCWNVADFKAPNGFSESNSREIIQFDSHCDRVYLGPTYGYDTFDDVVSWGVTINAGTLVGYLSTMAPSGQGNMGTLHVEEIGGDTKTGLLKMYCGTGYNLGKVQIGRIVGNGPVTIGDSGDESTSGGGFDDLTIGEVNNRPLDLSGTHYHQMSLGGSSGAKYAFTTGKRNVRIGKFTNNMVAGSTKNGLHIGSEFGTISIQEWEREDTTSTAYDILITTATADIEKLIIGSGRSGSGNAGCFIKFDNASSRVGSISISDFDYIGSDAVNRYGTLVDAQIGANVENLYLTNVLTKNCTRAYYLGGTTRTTNLFISNWSIDNCQWGTYLNNPGATINAVFDGIRVLAGGIVNTVFGWAAGNGSANTRIVGRGVECPAGQFIYAGSGSYRFSLDCPERDAGWDFAGTYAAKNTPRSGDKVWNTNAGYGAGVGLYGCTAAGAWAKVF